MTSIERVLFPTDFSEASSAALPLAAQWAQAFGAELHVLHVKVLHDLHSGEPAEEPSFPGFAEYLEAINRRTGELMDRLLASGSDDCLEIHRATRRGTAAAPEILACADEIEADLVVMATHGRRGLRRLFLGSVAEEVVRHASRPVLTVRGDVGASESGQGSVLVPLDFSGLSEQALGFAALVSGWTGAKVHLLHVAEMDHPVTSPDAVTAEPEVALDQVEQESRDRMRALLDRVGIEADRVELHVVDGSPSHRILEWVEEHRPDLLIQGSQGRTGTARFLIGSVAERVVNQATCPVLTVKAPLATKTPASSALEPRSPASR